MNSLDLLAREDEFKKLNKQLEKKTESLMKEIEHVMKKPDFFSEFTPNLSLSPAHNIKKHRCDAQKPITQSPIRHRPDIHKKIMKNSNNKLQVTKSENNTYNYCDKNVHEQTELENGTQNDGNGFVLECDGQTAAPHSRCDNHNIHCRILCDCCKNNMGHVADDFEFLYAFVSVNVKDKVLPHSFLRDNVTVENVCKFLSSKVKLMQEQIEKLQNTLDEKASQCESHLKQLSEMETSRMTLLCRANNLKATNVEINAKCLALQNKLDEKDRLYKEQRSECDKLSSEVKRLKSGNATAEARCATQEETIDNLRQQLELARRAEKELRDSTRNLSASHQTAISRLETQNKALTSRLDKQMALIDNLRRQNVLLSTEGALKALEKEYFEFLNQDL